MTSVAITASTLLLAHAAAAATITVTPADSYQKIEAAQAGDEVVIAPGTYAFRVHLTKVGTADKPIVIRAQDPARPPVWDFGDTLVENAPGSYTAGDRSRGCWQISGGAHYDISGIVFTHCRNAGRNSSGLRYYNGAIGNRMRDCVFRGNDNGLTGGTEDSEMTVEYSEFDGNGNVDASAPTHNIYVFAGTFTLRYSYLHDPTQGQNFHVRAKNSVIEYNWIARAKSYEGDLMSSDDLGSTSAVRQVMLLRGNVFLQNSKPGNNSQVIAVYNDGEVAGLSFTLRLVNNTFVGNGGRAALVHLSNEDGTTMRAELVNNIVAGTSVVSLVEDTSAGAVSGNNNWIVTGASASGLTASVSGAEPGFANAAGKDFSLAGASPAIGKAATTSDLPDHEYYRDESVARQGRARTTAKDLGAFESSTTSAPVGPYGPSGGTPSDGGLPTIDALPGSGGVAGTGGRNSGGSTGSTGSGGAGGGGATGARDAAVGLDLGMGGRDAARGIDAGTGDASSRPEVGTPVAVGGALGTGGAAPAVGGSLGTGGVTAAVRDAALPSDLAGGGARTAGTSSGCGCDLGGSRRAGGGCLVVLFLALLVRRRSTSLPS